MEAADNFPEQRNDIQLALQKQQGDKIKSKIKKLLQGIDGNSSGKVKSEVFRELLALHNVNISEKNWSQLRASCSVRKGPDHDNLIHYKDALPLIALNMEVADPLERDWIVRTRKSVPNGGVTFS